MTEPEYEYGVWYATTREPWRTGMTKAEAVDWVQGWEDDGGKKGVFLVMWRVISPWSVVRGVAR
jgi:hypothetical protein